MRSPVSAQTQPVIPFLCAAALSLLCLFAASQISAQNQPSPSSARERMHQSDQWAEIQKHLPDPATATPQALEQQADILRARNFRPTPWTITTMRSRAEATRPSLMNKLGLAELEMGNIQLARVVLPARREGEPQGRLRMEQPGRG